MIRDICKDEAFLARKAEPATQDDIQVATDLLETLEHHKDGCVDMAANMIGVDKRIIAFDNEGTYSKPLSDLPAVDMVVTMGCNVQCPTLPCSHREDWGLDDPSGKEDSAFLTVMAQIEEKVLDLKRRIQAGKLG